MSDLMLTNYARVGHVIQQIFPEVLQQWITKKEHPDRLAEDVRRNKYLSSKLTDDENEKIEHAKENGYENFDICLIYTIVRNLNKVDAPTKGWGYKYYPAPDELTLGDEFERLRRIRNVIVHLGNTRLSEVDKNTCFDVFEEIAKRLQNVLPHTNGNFVQEIQKLRTCRIDESLRKENLELLKKQKELEKDVLEKFEDAKGDLAFLTGKEVKYINIKYDAKAFPRVAVLQERIKSLIKPTLGNPREFSKTMKTVLEDPYVVLYYCGNSFHINVNDFIVTKNPGRNMSYILHYETIPEAPTVVICILQLQDSSSELLTIEVDFFSSGKMFVVFPKERSIHSPTSLLLDTIRIRKETVNMEKMALENFAEFESAMLG